MKAALITLAAIIGIGLIGLCMLMSSRNGAINLEEQVNTAKSGIDVQLSNRFNKLHELAACVKKYDEHEYNTLVKVIEARGKNMSGTEAKQCIAAFSRVEERYPEWGTILRVSAPMNYNVHRDKLGNIKYRSHNVTVVCQDQGYKAVHYISMHEQYVGSKYTNGLPNSDRWNFGPLYLVK